MFFKNKQSMTKPFERSHLVAGVASTLLLAFSVGIVNAHDRNYYHHHQGNEVEKELFKGAIIGGLLGGKKGAKKGAIAGAIIGGIKRSERRKYRRWERLQWEDHRWNNFRDY